jgi:hypothetical protein
MPKITAKLAVGYSLHANVLLHFNSIANAAVLGLSQLRGGYLALLVLLPGLAQLGRAQETTDMIGAKRRFVFFCHESFPPTGSHSSIIFLLFVIIPT